MRFRWRSGGSRELRVDVCFLLAVSAVFLGLSLHQIHLPGLYGDELDKLVPTVALLNGHPFLYVGWSETVLGVRVLLAFTDRIGTVLSYLPMPFILMLGYTPLALRLSSVLCAVLTLVFAYYGAKLWFGPWAARFGVALTAVSPVFVFLQRMGYYNYGPVTAFTCLTFFFLGRYISKLRSLDLWAAAAFAGIALNTGPQALFVLLPMVLLAVLCLEPLRVRPRDVIVAASVLLLVSSPVLITALRTGAVFTRLGWSGDAHAGLTFAAFLDTLSEHMLHFRCMLGGLDGVHFGALGRDIRNVWMNYAFMLSAVGILPFFFLSRKKRFFVGRSGAPLLITVLGLFLTGFILDRAGRISYQLIVLWPFPVFVIAVCLARLHERFRRVRLATIGLVSALIITQAMVTVEAHRLLSRTGGRAYTSCQVYALAAYIGGQRDLRAVAMDWGLLNQIYYLTGGDVLPEAIHGWWPKGGPATEEWRAAMIRELDNPDNVYIFLGPGEGMFDRYPYFEELVMAAGKEAVEDRVFRERDGSVAYRLYRVLSRDTIGHSAPGPPSAKTDAGGMGLGTCPLRGWLAT